MDSVFIISCKVQRLGTQCLSVFICCLQIQYIFMPILYKYSMLLSLVKTAVQSTNGRAAAQLLRHYATNWQVTGSIPVGVIGIFQ
jgi:hypothetical protein